MKTLDVSDNFNMPRYSHSNLVSKAIKNMKIIRACKRGLTIAIKSIFNFSGVDKADVEKSIGNFNFDKLGTLKDISIKCLKVTSDMYSPFFTSDMHSPFFAAN